MLYFWKCVVTTLISMVPVIELRGGLPFGLAENPMPWGIPTLPALPYWLALILSVVGNCLPVPLILFFLFKVFGFIRRHFPKFDGFLNKLEERGREKGKALEKGLFWGLLILVAIPLPGTGAWTGSLVASVLDVPPKKAFPPIVLGVVAAGMIVTVVFYCFRSLFTVLVG